MIFDKDYMFDLFCNFISGGFMRKKTTSEVYFSFYESIRYVRSLSIFQVTHLLTRSLNILDIYIVTKGILKGVEIQEMTIPAFIS